MIKVYTDEKLRGAPSVSKFEIVGTSNKPKSPRLSKNLIALLHYGGVPREFFLGILRDALVDAQTFLSKKRAALRAAISRDVDDDYTIARMILSGIPLDEPFLQHRLSVIAKDEFKNLKAGRLPVADSFYVMGTADPTRTLSPGEVCVILEHGQISGAVLVYRNPGIHPGDIHIVNATYVKALEDMVGNSKYAIFFPVNGPRSMADEIAGGDYDGDMYWVSRNPELLKYFRPSPPWTCNTSSPKMVNRKPSDLTDDVLERDLFRMYLSTRFTPSKAMGVAADSWLVFMDRILTLDDDCKPEKELLMKKINKLIDKYYDALDAPKKGKKVEILKDLIPEKYPHHMERGEFCTYKSSSILGQIHDEVDAFNNFDPIQVWRLPCFQEQIDQIPLARLLSWKAYYNDYRCEMAAALRAGDESKNESAVAVYRKYKRILYGVGSGDDADELEKSRKPWEEIRIEALAAYNAAYDHANQEADPQKCNFAWKVAGSALLKIFMKEKSEKPLQCAPSVLREMFL